MRLFRFIMNYVATCACDCGCGTRVPAGQVMCTPCANGNHPNQ